MQLMDRSGILPENITAESWYLKRKVIVDLYLPPSLTDFSKAHLLLVNDGQDMEKLGLKNLLDRLYDNKELEPVIFAAIHASADRKLEYGVAGIPDFKGRGKRAGHYSSFIMAELLPLLRKKFKVTSFNEQSFAGFSLGGLTALDIVWNHPADFKYAAVFSGSLWWRSVDQTEEDYDDDRHRIMHQQIRKGVHHPGLKFFFQCGNMDETRDRNKNGVIDSIDDTLDLVKELQLKGYQLGKDIAYLELKDGHHDIPTWGRAMPEFLEWAFADKKKILPI